MIFGVYGNWVGDNKLVRVLKMLKDVKIIDYVKDVNKKIIYINPLFSNRNLKIHPGIYKRFKTQLDGVLEEKEIKYLELLTFNDKDSGALILKDKPKTIRGERYVEKYL